MFRFLIVFIVSFQLFAQSDTSNLETVVVSATSEAAKSKNATIHVQTLSTKQLQLTHSTSLVDGLNYSAGIRVETDCQTCNYSQVRMNGLPGSYSQIVINNRPVFSALMGLYGLDQLPPAMIQQVEIVRGAGSVLYGNNALGGTINIITKAPCTFRQSFAQQVNWIGNQTPETSTQLNVNFNSKNDKWKHLLLVSHRYRGDYDANRDGFSELSKLASPSIGWRFDRNIGARWKSEVLLWALGEERRGGDQIKRGPQEALQAEYRKQGTGIVQVNISGRDKKNHWKSNFYTSGQWTKRKHYTGVLHADGWGNTNNSSLQIGGNTVRSFTKNHFKTTVLLGLEGQVESTFDQIPAYHYFIDQTIIQSAAFSQVDVMWKERLQLQMGGRIAQHSRVTHPISVPRLAVKWNCTERLSLRYAYGVGFKAPQAFETDMHIAFASGSIQKITIDPNLKPEEAHSHTLVLNWNKRFGKQLFSTYITGFYNRIENSFMLKELHTDSIGMNLLRTNGSSAIVQGVSVEVTWSIQKWFSFSGSWTLQQANYSEAETWSNEVTGSKRLLRTPNSYGSLIMELFGDRLWSGNINLVQTGSMLVPHFGGSENQPADKLVQTEAFWEVGCFVQRKWHLHPKEIDLKASCGIQNLINAYQKDFDTGWQRDSNYIYGPNKPRTVVLRLQVEF